MPNNANWLHLTRAADLSAGNLFKLSADSPTFYAFTDDVLVSTGQSWCIPTNHPVNPAILVLPDAYVFKVIDFDTADVTFDPATL